MSETSTIIDNNNPKEVSLLIIKALAVIFVVVASAGSPSWITNIAYIFSYPVLFVYAGYSFDVKYLRDEKAYLVRQFKKIYSPFWIWSVIFLILHNLFFSVGFLNENFKGLDGSVSYQYTWNEFVQRLWDVSFNMSGYDSSLCEPFWFFRALFIGSISFLVLFKITSKLLDKENNEIVASLVLMISFLLISWLIVGNLHIEGLADGGYRELLAVFFMSLGVLFRGRKSYFSKKWWTVIAGFVIIALSIWLIPIDTIDSVSFVGFLELLLPVIGAFILLQFVSVLLAKAPKNKCTSLLAFIGGKAFYIIAFHLLSFKLVSIILILIYDLPWLYLADYTVMASESVPTVFCLLYVLVGLLLPLLTIVLWKLLDKKYNLTIWNCLVYSCWAVLLILKWSLKFFANCSKKIWFSLKNFGKDMKQFVNASNPKDE